MTAIQPFTPPPVPAAVVELRLPRYAGAPLTLASHGYDYTVTGNTLLPAAALRRAIEAAADPSAAVGALSALYRERGYLLVAVRANVLEHQVTVAVVEGRITSIKANAGVARFYDGVEFDPTVNNNALIRRNVLAEAYASRDGLGFRPSVGPAQQPGGSELVVDTPAQPNFRRLSGSLVFGNYGSRYVGGDIAAINLQAQLGDGWLVAANYSHGMPSLQKSSAGSRYDAGSINASRVTPWGIYGASINENSYRLGVAGAPYYPQGQTSTYALTGNQLIWADATARLSVNQALTHVASVNSVLGGSYVLADQNYNYGTVGLQTSRSVLFAGLAGAVNFSANYNLGLSAPRGTMVYDLASAPQTRFHYWTTSLGWQQALPQGWSFNLNASGQWGLDTLPGNQQWVVGGYGSLSAFTASLSGDGGYLMRAVTQAPSWAWRGWQASIQGFAEQGAATTHYTAAGNPAWKMMADIGVGLTLTSPRNTTLSLIAARPISSKNVTSAVFNSQRAVYFVLQQPF